MQPWQVSLGLSFATLFTSAWYVLSELAYLQLYFAFAWELYGIRFLFISVAFSVGVIWIFYSVAHVVSLSTVGSRIEVIDRAIRDGQVGDAELQDALRREESGEYLS